MAIEPLTPEKFAERRRARLAAAETDEAGDTPVPEDGGTAEPEAGGAPLLGGEAPQDEPVEEILELDEGSGDEPAELPGLEPPASMTADERAFFVQLDPSMQAYMHRMHMSAARSAQEAGEKMAARTKEIDARAAALDQQLAATHQMLTQQVNQVPYSDQDLAAIAAEHGFAEWQKADAVNKQAEADAKKQLAEVEGAIASRQREVLDKFEKELPEFISSWAKPETRRAEGKEVSDYLRSEYGYTDADLRGFVSAPLAAMARKAMLYDRALARKRNGGKKAGGGNVPAPAPRGRAPAGKSVADAVAQAAQRYSENPNAETFAAKRRAQRAAEAVPTRRRA